MTESEVLDKLVIFRDALKNKNEEIRNLKGEIELLNNKATQSAAQLEQVNQLLKEIKEQSDEEISDLHEKLAFIREQNDELDSYCSVTRAENNSLKESLKELDELKEKIVSLQELNSGLSSSNAEIEQLKNTNEGLSTDIKNLAGENTSLKEELKKEQKLRESFTIENSELKSDAQQRDIVISDLEKEVCGYKEQISFKDNGIVFLQEKINSLESLISEIENDQKNIGFIKDTGVSNTNNSEPPIPLRKVKVSKEVEPLVYYRFGHTTPTVKEQLIALIKELYKGIDDRHPPYQLNDINISAERVGLPEKTKTVLARRLKEMTHSGVPLVYERDDTTLSDFTEPFLVDFMTSRVK